MKRLLVVLVCGLCVFLMNSCQTSANSVKQGSAGFANRFPKSLAGTWKADASKWQITLAPDGNVVSIANASGSIMVIAEGGYFENGPTEGTFLYLSFGPCYTNYNPATRELGVTVTLQNFHMEFPDRAFEADMKYYITGPVSKDSKRWDAKLFNYISPRGGRPTDPNLVKPESLVFHKVENN